MAILPECLSADAIRKTLISHPRDSESMKPEEESAIQNRIQEESRSSIISKWLPTDIKELTKGLKKFGKNFDKIRTKYLPMKETSEIISFFNAWKRNQSEVKRSSDKQRRLIAESITEAEAEDEIYDRMFTKEKPETRTIDVSIKKNQNTYLF